MEILHHGALDTLKIIPLLFLTYLLMEYLEHHAGENMEGLIRRSGRWGALFGSLLGLIPQCGLAGAAAGFYSGRIITPGTLLAIFLATSDEMLPLLISASVPLSTILPILGCKLVIGLTAGFLLDAVWKEKRMWVKDDICTLCADSDCGCNEHGIVRAALHHTLHIGVFLLVVTCLLSLVLHLVGLEKLMALQHPVFAPMLAAAVGLIPNCSPSVVLTQLYISGIVSGGAMMAGLLSNAGIGLLVLFRTNHDRKENLVFTALLFAVGALCGWLLELLAVTF